MKKIWRFLMKLKNDYVENELLYLGNELTYKILVSLFPLLILIVYVFSFIQLDYISIFNYLDGTVPNEILNILKEFTLNQPKTPKTTNTMSSLVLFAAIFASIYSSSSGFVAIIRGINKTYSVHDKRNFIHLRLISMFLVLLFLLGIILSLVLLIFGDAIINFIVNLGLIQLALIKILSFFSYFVTILLIVIMLMLIYKLSSYKKIPLMSTLPGAIITLFFWIISSKLFNIYINNFSSYSKIYGSIGSLFILILWINIIALVLLFGSQINAIIYYGKESKVLED